MKVSLRRIRLTKKDIQSYLAIQRAINSEFTLITESEEEAYQDIGTSTAYFILVDGKKAGAISYEVQIDNVRMRNYAYIHEVSVRPNFEKRGIGRKALEMILKETMWLSEHELVVHPRNTRAVVLYLKAGFVVCELKNDFFNDGEPRLIMVRKQHWGN